MKFTSVYLLVALAICVKGNHVKDRDDREEVKSKGDVSGSMREGWKRLKEMAEDLMENERKTTRTTMSTERMMKTTRTTTNNPNTLSISDLVQSHGYPFEEHEVTTPDGYVILMHRIPHGKDMVNKKQRTPVFLQHGLLSSSDSWLLNDPELSLPYLLSNAGYDVWMGNTRGNIYGRKHVTMKPEQPEFWNFSWDDIARHDLPTMINYVVKLTDTPVEKFGNINDDNDLNSILYDYENPSFENYEFSPRVQKPRLFKYFNSNKGKSLKFNPQYDEQSIDEQSFNKYFDSNKFENIKFNPKGKLHYIGHSEGALLGFVQFGRDPELSSKISLFIALGPIGNLGSGETPFSYFLKNFDFSKNFNQEEVFTNEQLKNYINDNFCGKSNIFDELCKNVLYSLSNSMNEPIYNYLFSHYPTGTSKKNINHYLQFVKSGKFQAYDYGKPEVNQKYYKQTVPPQYNLRDVNVPVVLFYGNNDFIVSNEDYEYIKKNLPNVVYNDLIDTFGHLDFVFSKLAKDNVYDKIINLLSSSSSSSSEYSL